MGVWYCEVALGVPLRHTFTYAIPEALAEVAAPGSRVVVPFRNRALAPAVIQSLFAIRRSPPKGYVQGFA